MLAVLKVGGVIISFDSSSKVLEFEKKNLSQTTVPVILTSDQNVALLSRPGQIAVPVGLESLARLTKTATGNHPSATVPPKFDNRDLTDNQSQLTKTEAALRQIWARVLDIKPASIGVNDSFFRLGGDSITAMQISSAARESLGYLPTTDILRKQTISRFTASLDKSAQSQPSIALAIPKNSDKSFSLNPIQQFHLSLNPNPNVINNNIFRFACFKSER